MQLEQLVEVTKGIDAIYHLAAVSDVNIAFKNPLGCVDANIRGTANVLEAARINKFSRVIFASTVWVYQASPETRPTEATSFALDHGVHLYTYSKIAGEMLCHSYQQLYGIPFTILRYGIPYGPFMRQALLIPIFVKKALAGEPLLINGDGSQFRRFIYVEDLARGNVAALSSRAANQTYNLEGKEKVSVLELAKAIDQILGGVKIQFEPARPGDLKGVEIDSSKALIELGWQPTVPFEEGLRRTVAWLLTLSQKHFNPLQLASR
jgi:UDP-glucose 4-epimerase